MRAKSDSISAIIDKRELKLMQELPVSSIWMDKLFGLSMSVKYNPMFTNKEETLALYNRLSEEQKAFHQRTRNYCQSFPSQNSERRR